MMNRAPIVMAALDRRVKSGPRRQKTLQCLARASALALLVLGGPAAAEEAQPTGAEQASASWPAAAPLTQPLSDHTLPPEERAEATSPLPLQEKDKVEGTNRGESQDGLPGPSVIAEIRALTLQFDAIANRGSALSAPLDATREKYGALIRDAEARGLTGRELREQAEIFVLGGGDPSVLPSCEEGEGIGGDNAEKKLCEGVVAYGQGRTKAAEASLLPLDASSFDALRGGHLALVQALLSTRINPARAFEAFDTARRLLPGTLVEEAALRQIVVLAARTGDRERFANAALTYLRRFHRSDYVAGFEAQLAFHIVRFEGGDGLLILKELLNAHPRGWERCLPCFLTTIAGQAVLAGKIELARSAAETALPLATDGSPEKQRLLLYEGAALLVTEDYVRGLDTLKAVQASGLDNNDKALLAAALGLAAKLRATPMLFTEARFSASAEDKPKHERDFVPGAPQSQAKAALASVDAMLAQAR